TRPAAMLENLALAVRAEANLTTRASSRSARVRAGCVGWDMGRSWVIRSSREHAVGLSPEALHVPAIR
ncbi:hypothetical protein ACFL5O_12065, partial [Myxococcota bacterium]